LGIVALTASVPLVIRFSRSVGKFRRPWQHRRRSSPAWEVAAGANRARVADVVQTAGMKNAALGG
jgi:hypothetical protein